MLCVLPASTASTPLSCQFKMLTCASILGGNAGQDRYVGKGSLGTLPVPPGSAACCETGGNLFINPPANASMPSNCQGTGSMVMPAVVQYTMLQWYNYQSVYNNIPPHHRVPHLAHSSLLTPTCALMLVSGSARDGAGTGPSCSSRPFSASTPTSPCYSGGTAGGVTQVVVLWNRLAGYRQRFNRAPHRVNVADL